MLELLELWGLLGGGQLEGLLFENSGGGPQRLKRFLNEPDPGFYDRYSYKRLSKLEEAGHLAGCSMPGVVMLGETPPKVYVLTRQGQAALERAGRSKAIALRRGWSERAICKFIEANGIGLALQELHELRILPHHFLLAMNRAPGKKGSLIRKITPDLEIKAAPSLPLFIEYRWLRLQDKRKLVRLIAEHWPMGCLWLTWKWAEQDLMRFAKEAGISSIYAARMDEFQSDMLATPFKNTDGQAHVLGRLGA